ESKQSHDHGSHHLPSVTTGSPAGRARRSGRPRPSPGPRLLSSPLGLEPLDDHGASGSTACPSLTPILLQWYSSACRDGDTAPNLSSRPSNRIKVDKAQVQALPSLLRTEILKSDVSVKRPNSKALSWNKQRHRPFAVWPRRSGASDQRAICAPTRNSRSLTWQSGKQHRLP